MRTDEDHRKMQVRVVLWKLKREKRGRRYIGTIIFRSFTERIISLPEVSGATLIHISNSAPHKAAGENAKSG